MALVQDPTRRERDGRSRGEQAAADRLETVRRLVTRALGPDAAALLPDDTNPGALANGLPPVVAALRAALADRPALDERAERLLRAALATQDLAAEAQARVVGLRAQLDADVERGLAELRGITSPNELLDRACQQVVRSCGFRRAMLSRVEGTTWQPWQVRFDEDRDAEATFATWMDGVRIDLDEAPLEREVLEQRRPALVLDATADPRVHAGIVAAGRTRSYVVAPIIPAGRVVGFLHADHMPSQRPVDETDRYALWAFAEGFGRLYERAVLIERLQAQRSQIHETFDLAEEMMASLATADLELVRDPTRSREEQPAAGDGDGPVPRAEIDALLTEREREVLQLMVRGLANGAIAERLVIKEGTVKSHVKHILRKLGAVNRAEAISRYLGGTFD
ncbi:GAF domain-containing protein [Conexibacter sp. W3-3-2]|uniref:LuxR C-terminal-related transcriptional regulator n=1 Tax=Conexibacter sp. W3-3-2 TaxID=2675227 RepID=UPI0012B9FD2A|nr:LuxR C-terminal-related transcriptional regulator [Conexibacter sp. W3-3-2]MTD45863.1 GAF domain-containing protein [Conexibacter sp. W3-3-2]